MVSVDVNNIKTRKEATRCSRTNLGSIYVEQRRQVTGTRQEAFFFWGGGGGVFSYFVVVVVVAVVTRKSLWSKKFNLHQPLN